MSKKRLFVNTGSNIFVTFLKMAIAFIMTPILVRNLGNYDYGMWEIIVSIIGYMGLLDLGFRPSVTRNIAYFFAKKDVLAMNRVFSTAFAFMMVLSSISFAIFILWAYIGPESLAEEGSSAPQRYQYLLIIIACQLAFFFPGSVAESTLDGFHKYFLKNNVTIVNTLIGNFLIWYFITPANAILVVAGVSAAGVSIKYIIFYVFIYRNKITPMRPKLEYVRWATFKELIIFGSKSFVQGVVWRIQTSMDPILIAWVLSPAYVIFYAIPSNLIGYFRGIAMTMTQAFLPIFSEMAAQTDKSSQHHIYLQASKYVLALLIPIAVGIFVVGPEFIGFWIGDEYAIAGENILYILTAITLISYIDPFSNKYLTAEDKHGIFAKVTPIAMLVNIGTTIYLLNTVGVIGAAIGTLVPAILFSPIYWVYRSKIQKLSIAAYVKKVVVPQMVPTAIMVCTMVGLKRLYPMTSFTYLLIYSALGFFSYIVAFYFLSIERKERLAATNLIVKRLKK